MPRFEAAIFDVDGVLVASPHERAWREALASIVATRWGADRSGTYAPERFTTAVYQEHVAGKARHAGARAALEHFAMPALDERTLEYAQEKQSRLDALIDAGEFVAFPDALRFVVALRARGFHLAAASSSKNANRFLARIRLDAFVHDDGRPRTSVAPGERLLDIFAVNVCGRDLPRGKPAPHIFVLAAEELGVLPSACVVVEDAPAGVQAGKAAGMATIGIARLDDAPLLEEAGADLVVSTLDEVDVDALAEGRLARVAGASGTPRHGELVAGHERFVEHVAAVMEPSPDPAWLLRQEGYSPLEEIGIESRFSIANGFLGVRGARAVSRGPMWMSFLHTLSWASWPRTFVAGLFDTPNTEPPVPALAPAPDWLRVRLMLDGEPLLLRSGELLAHSRTLDMRRGVMLTEWHQRDPKGRVIRLRELRMVSMADRPLGMQLVELHVDAVPSAVTFETALEVANSGLELARMEQGLAVWRTASSAKCLALASAGELRRGTELLPPALDGQLQREWRWTSTPGEAVGFWRVVSFARNDDECAALRAAVRRPLERALRSGWRDVLDAHVDAWVERWTSSDVAIDGADDAQRALRFAIYHLNSAANPDDEHVSIGARALTGDAYLGHVFWDTEIYLVPFYTFTWPAAARALLMYRWHTLPGARAKAARLGYRGALYPWESADTGDETTPDQILDAEGRIIRVLSGLLEHHISADVAHAVWQYWQATGDDAFLLAAGAEIVLETARFWASRAEADDIGAYHIRHVIGPDEYHEDVDDNAFTNVMAAWNIARALDLAALLPRRHPARWAELASALQLDDAELARWRTVSAHLVTGYDPHTGLIEQFAGYFDLEDVHLAQYAGRTAPMDVVLGRERTQYTQVVKQADVVALLGLLPEAFAPSVITANLRYYEPRCGHGSSLSRSLHAVVAARLGDVAMAERYFAETAATDLSDTRGGSAGGVRIAALGGLWQAALFGFAGLALRPDGLALDPHLPDGWRGVAFQAQWRGRSVHLALDGARRVATATLERGPTMVLHVSGKPHVLEPGARVQAEWNGEVAAASGPHWRPAAGALGA